MPGTWKIDSSAASSLDQDLTRTLDDFRSKQLFDFGYADPEKIEYHAGRNLAPPHPLRNQLALQRQKDGQRQRGEPRHRPARSGRDKVSRHRIPPRRKSKSP